MEDDRNTVVLQPREQPECLRRNRIEILVVRTQLDPFAAQVAHTTVVLILPVGVERVQRHERYRLVRILLRRQRSNVIMVQPIFPPSLFSHEFLRSPRSRRDPEDECLVNRRHVAVIVGDAVRQLHRLTRPHRRFRHHLIPRHGVPMARQMGVDIDDHGALPRGGS